MPNEIVNEVNLPTKGKKGDLKPASRKGSASTKRLNSTSYDNFTIDDKKKQ